MAVEKTSKGWKVDIQPEGRGGKRLRRTFTTKRAADQFVIEQKALANAGEWKPLIKDARRLTDLVKDWFDLYGHTLKDGKRRKTSLLNVCNRLEDPQAKIFDPEIWLRYRKERLAQITVYKSEYSPNTLNHEQAYLSALFGTLIKLGNWPHANPLSGIPKLKIDEIDLVYLELPQVKKLLSALASSRNRDALAITKLCLATGARWSEAQKLDGKQIRNGQVTYINTKNSEARAVPISKELEIELLNNRPRIGRLFEKEAKKAFGNAIDRAGIALPFGQKTHVLRRTFASHFMINDGNILKLQKILGHKTLAMTMRYARLAPNHLTQALDKNPLFLLGCQQSVNAKVK